MERRNQSHDARSQRNRANSFLRDESYRWKKFENDEEDQDFFGAPPSEWVLYSPDGRVVSTQQAMQELAFAGKHFAREWLLEHNIAEQTPEIEVQRQQKREQAQRDEQEQQARQYDKEKYVQDVTQELLLNGFSPEQARNEAIRLSQPHRPFEDDVQITEPVRLDEDDVLTITFNSSICYGVQIGDDWRGIDYMLRLHDILVEKHDLLLQLSQRNRELNP